MNYSSRSVVSNNVTDKYLLNHCLFDCDVAKAQTKLSSKPCF